MNLELKELIDYNITPNQYILLHTIKNNYKSKFKNLIKIIGEDQSINDLKSSVNKGFISCKEEISKDLDINNFSIRNKFLFITKEGDYFDELVEEYPVKVYRPDGTKDYLRSDLKRCKKNYLKIAPTKKKHERILNALKFEKQVREKENSWKYMKKLPKWLSSEEWKIYEERMEDESKEKETDLGYGQELL